MKLSSVQRAAVFKKTGGHCWYCGCELPARGWHADHIEPLVRVNDIAGKPTGIVQHPERHCDENLAPCCANCNRHKATMSVEQFRKEIAAQTERARRSSFNFRTAERFGLVEVVEKPIIFWFERHVEREAAE